MAKCSAVLGVLFIFASTCVAQGYSAANQCYCNPNPWPGSHWNRPAVSPPCNCGTSVIGSHAGINASCGPFYALTAPESAYGSRPVPYCYGPSGQTTTEQSFPLGSGGHYGEGWSYPTEPNLCQPMTGSGYGDSCTSNIQPRPAFCGARRFFGGFEALALRTDYDQNVAMIIDPLPGNDQVPFDYGYGFSPRVWLGICGSACGGFRTTYWYFDATADRETATAVAGATPVYLFVYGAGGNLTRNAYADLGETLTSIHSTRLQSLDFEFFDSIGYSCWNLQPSAGLRLAEIVQNLRGDVYNAVGGLEETVTNELTVRGAGPTASFRAVRSIRCSPFGLYGGARGSLLFSQTSQEIYEMKNAGANQVRDRARHDEILSVFELALGLQYNYCYARGLNTIAGVGYEVQVWNDVGGPVDSSSTLGLNGLTASLGLLF